MKEKDKKLILYISKLSWGSPVLTKVFISKEMPVTYQVEKREDIIGTNHNVYSGKRLRKDEKGLFYDYAGALDNLIERMRKHIEWTTERLAVSKEQCEMLVAMKKEKPHG